MVSPWTQRHTLVEGEKASEKRTQDEMASPGDPATAAPSDEEVKSYRVRISSKYQELTRQKLELTRLPHEISQPKSKDWWEPKSQVEPLIDYWLEQYSWQEQEEELNASLPQFRVGIKIPKSKTPVRVHFIHSRSPHANAVPLLLIPPFPFTNLSLGHLIKGLVDPDDAGAIQPFHLVIPSLPGVGFSDALPNNTPMIATIAEMLDILMKKLEYPQYIATNSGAAAISPAEIDWKLASYLSNHYSSSCLGFHFISPPLTSPKLRESPVEWTKWTAAKLFRAPILGYSKEDFSALQRSSRQLSAMKKTTTPSQMGLHGDGEYEPNTLAYALCDSPTGLLLFIMKIVRTLGAKKELTPAEIITLTELMWLPGPEAVLRLWAHGASDNDALKKKPTTKPKIGLTVFLGDEEAAAGAQKQEAQVSPRAANDTYTCPGWVRHQYNVVSSARVPGKPGLLAWERPEVIADGVRGLAKAILAVDKRIQASDQPGIALLEQVVVEGGRTAPADLSGTTVQSSNTPTSPQTKKVHLVAHKPGASSLAPPEPATKKRFSSEAPQPVTPKTTALGEGSRDLAGRAHEGDSPDTIIAVPPIAEEGSK